MQKSVGCARLRQDEADDFKHPLKDLTDETGIEIFLLNNCGVDKSYYARREYDEKRSNKSFHNPKL